MQEVQHGLRHRIQRPGDVELQECRGEVRGGDELFGRLGVAESPGQRRDDEDRGEKRQRVSPPHQQDGDDQTEHQQGDAVIERAEADDGRRVGSDHAGIAQADEDGTQDRNQP